MVTCPPSAAPPVRPWCILPFENNSGADAGAERGVEELIAALAGPPKVFGESGCIGVVVHARGHAEDAPGLGRQRKAAPARHVRRIQHHARFGVQRPGRAESDAGDRGARFRGRREYGFNCVHHRGKAGGGVAGRNHGHARFVSDFTGGIHQARGNLGPADIDANNHGCLASYHWTRKHGFAHLTLPLRLANRSEKSSIKGYADSGPRRVSAVKVCPQ